MHERFQKLCDRFVQLTGSRRFIAGSHARSDAGAATPVGSNQAFLLQFGVGARNRIWRDAEIARELPNRGQCVAGAQFAAFDKAAKLVHDLLERRKIGIDREEQIAHDADEGWRPKNVQYRMTEMADTAQVHQETLWSVRSSGGTTCRL